jgi:CPA2 family monovalent cation:H+ antiporter-2
MLIDPRTLLAQAGLVGLVSAVAIVGKAAIVAIIVLALGMPARVAILAGLSLAQVGEFSFVLARVGVEDGAIPASLFDLTLATALVTIVLSPTLPRLAPALLGGFKRLPFVGHRFDEPVEAPSVEGLRQHTVICGYGRVGRELAAALEARGLRYLVVEYNPLIVRELRAKGVPVVYGDAANPVVLAHTELERAKVLAVLVPDARVAEAATRAAHVLNRRLDVVARAVDVHDVERLRRAGAAEVVQPEFEAAVEVVRHALRRYGVGGMELVHAVAGRRAAFYRRGLEGEVS